MNKARRGLARINEVLHHLIRVKTLRGHPLSKAWQTEGAEAADPHCCHVPHLCGANVNDEKNWYGCNVALVPLFPKCILFPQICPDFKKKCWEVNLRLQKTSMGFLHDAIYSDI